MKIWLTIIFMVFVVSSNYSQYLLDLFSSNIDSASLKLEMIKGYLAKGTPETDNFSRYKLSFSEADVDYMITVYGKYFGDNREVIESVNILIKYNDHNDLPPNFKNHA